GGVGGGCGGGGGGGGAGELRVVGGVEEEGELGFVRQAVGDHLLLGGDNMDLALAKFVEGKLPGGGKLDAAQYGLLTQACRQAKEKLFASNPPGWFPVTGMGRWPAGIGRAFRPTLTPAH